MKKDSARMPAKLGQSAFEMFAEEGFGKVNLDQIAARAGVTKGSLYWHYKSKKELILAACNFYYQRWHSSVQSEIAKSVDPLERIRKTLEYSVYSCVIDSRNRVFTTGIFALMQEDSDVRASWTQFYNSVREFYIGLVASAKATGAVDVENPRAAVDLMLEAMEGIKIRAAFEPHIAEPSEQEELVEGMMFILCGLRAEKAA